MAAAACSGGETIEPPPPPVDEDAGPRDVGFHDGGFYDGGVRDAGEVEPDAGGRDGGPPRDGGITPRRCDLALSPIFGGGTSTTTLDGRLSVFVIDRIDGTPIVDEVVVVEAETDALSARTDGVGCVDFVDPALTGTVTVSAFSREHVYRSVVGLGRDAVTLRLTRPFTNPMPERPARVAGIVSGFEVLTASTAMRARVGIVEPIRTDVFRPPITQRPNGDFGANVAVVGGPTMANSIGYDVFVDARFTTGLVVYGGTSETMLELTHFGISTGLSLRPDDLETGRPAVISTPFDVPIAVRRGASTGFIERTMYAVARVPNGDLFVLNEVDDYDGDGITAMGPSLAGPMAGGGYGGISIEWQQSMDEGAFSIVVSPATTSTTVLIGNHPLPPVMTQGPRHLETTLTEEVADIVRADFEYQWQIVLIDPPVPPVVYVPAVPLGYEDRVPLGATIFVTGLGLDGVDLQDVAAADPYESDVPTRPDFARGIRRWVQRTTFWIP